MKSPLPVCFILISALLSTNCTRMAPSATVSKAVIESVVPTPRSESPWRLDRVWQGGGLAGAVLRRSSIEHVVRQVDNQRLVVATNDNPAATRAVRTYFPWPLDITEDQAIIEHAPIPNTMLKPNCNSNVLLK